MTTNNLPNDDLVQLISALIDDDLSEQDHVRLTQMLASDAALRVIYYDQLRMHAQLTWNSHRAPVIGLSDLGICSYIGPDGDYLRQRRQGDFAGPGDV